MGFVSQVYSFSSSINRVQNAVSFRLFGSSAPEVVEIEMEASQSNTTTATATTTTTATATSSNPNPNPNPNANSILSSTPLWPTIDGPLGLTEDDSVTYARRFYKFGYALLPWLWAVNCFYFWPVLLHSRSFPRIRPYIVGSAIGFTVFSALLCSWALTFAIGGEQVFGPVWDKLVMYNVADRLGLTGFV